MQPCSTLVFKGERGPRVDGVDTTTKERGARERTCPCRLPRANAGWLDVRRCRLGSSPLFLPPRRMANRKMQVIVEETLMKNMQLEELIKRLTAEPDGSK